MDIQSWLTKCTAQLLAAGITTARLDCLVLLEDACRRDRSWLLSHPEHELQGSVVKKLDTKIAQRALHMPLAYLRGHAEFYGRQFVVNAHTLVPRPETETIIELLRGLHAAGKLPADARILDVGTGSGCIAITAALELTAASRPGAGAQHPHVSACDIDPKCLQTARQNAKTLGADVAFFESDLLAQTPGRYDVILANLPYVPDNFQINTAAAHEPRHALFGGLDGLDLYRRMFDQIAHAAPTDAIQQNKIRENSLESKPLYILAESLPPQHEVLAAIAKAAGYRLQTTDDFIQLFITS